MIQARGVIRNFVRGARNVVFDADVAMMALMHGQHAKKLSRWLRGCGGSLSVPVERSKIVGVRFDCSFTDIKAVGHGDVLQKTACQLEVAVCDSAVEIRGGDQRCGYLTDEGHPPNDWIARGRIRGCQGGVRAGQFVDVLLARDG